MKHSKILVTSLNWGLGHATRCIPIINELLQYPVEVTLASDGRALQLLQKEFPQLTCVELPAYKVRYSSPNMIWNIAKQSPKILLAIYQEHQTIKQIIQNNQIDLIISDNRYGCYSPTVQTIFMTHQINLRIPFKPLEKITNWFNHKWLEKFDTVWIPDYEGKTNLAGSLSRRAGLKNVIYLGALSRFIKKELPLKHDAIIVMSGPEPQRSILEKKIIEQAKKLPYKFLLIQGKTEKKQHFFIQKNIETRSFLTANELNDAILASNIVVARSGYSTLMDLIILGKKAVFIPTPGQTEQEYLAKICQGFKNSTDLKRSQFYSQTQDNLNLKVALEIVSQWDISSSSSFEGNQLKAVIASLLTVSE